MDDLEDRLRGLKPEGATRDRALPARAEQHLMQLQRRTRLSSRKRRSLVLTTAAVVVVISVTLCGILRVDCPLAFAITPSPLNFEEDERHVHDILNNAIVRVHDRSGPAHEERRSSYVGWFAQIDMEAPPSGSVRIAPEHVLLTWRADLSAGQTVTAVEPSSAE